MKQERETGARENVEALFCEVRLRGELGPSWTDWFDGLEVTRRPNGETLLSGVLKDQAALHGLLRKIRDLGLPLVSVNCNRSGGANAAEEKE